MVLVSRRKSLMFMILLESHPPWQWAVVWHPMASEAWSYTSGTQNPWETEGGLLPVQQKYACSSRWPRLHPCWWVCANSPVSFSQVNNPQPLGQKLNWVHLNVRGKLWLGIFSSKCKHTTHWQCSDRSTFFTCFCPIFKITTKKEDTGCGRS